MSRTAEPHPMRRYSVALALVAMGLAALAFAPFAVPHHAPLQLGGALVLAAGIFALFAS